MKKLFLAICFICVASHSIPASSKPREVSELSQVPQTQETTNKGPAKVYDVNAQEMADFLSKRLKSSITNDIKDVENSQVLMAEPSDEAKAQIIEDKKSTFEKIYEEALNRVTNKKTDPQYQEQPQTQPTREQQQQNWEAENIDVVNILLPPDNERIVVPAKEHIPYFYTRIEILPDEMVSFDETIITVNNQNKFKNALSLPLPKYSKSRSDDVKKIDYNLVGVSINGQPVEYKFSDNGQNIVLEPTSEIPLEAGTYRYNFRFLAKGLISNYDEFNEFYWDISGSSWNFVIARAGAAIILPTYNKPLGQNVYVGYADRLLEDYVSITNESENVLGMVSKVPLFPFEGMHAIVSIPKSAFIEPTFGKKMNNYINKYGDIIFSSFGLLALFISYILSWKYIRKNKTKLLVGLKKNAPMLRYLVSNKFDNISLVSFFLELYRKNIIDIQNTDNNILLIKKTDDLKVLSKNEKKALNSLFSQNDAVFSINTQNALKTKRAFNFVKKDVYAKLRNFVLKANSGYLFFGIMMLTITEFSIALLSYNPLFVFSTILFISLGFGVCLMVFNHQFSKKTLSLICKICSSIAIAVLFIILCGLVNSIAGLLLLICVYTIIDYTKIYAKRNGLLKSQINDAQEIKNFILKNQESIKCGRDFLTYQASIFALELEKHFAKNELNKDHYKLDIAEEISKRF